jgi:hypothetical protein
MPKAFQATAPPAAAATSITPSSMGTGGRRSAGSPRGGDRAAAGVGTTGVGGSGPVCGGRSGSGRATSTSMAAAMADWWLALAPFAGAAAPGFPGPPSSCASSAQMSPSPRAAAAWSWGEAAGMAGLEGLAPPGAAPAAPGTTSMTCPHPLHLRRKARPTASSPMA